MFLEFLYRLRAHGVPVSTHNWLALMEALAGGLHRNSLEGLYRTARCLLVASEVHYDAFDQAFAESFRGVSEGLEQLLDELDAWLKDPKLLEGIDPATLAALRGMDMEELQRLLRERLEEQKKRHEGGNKWIGTGGTSPFGQGGMHPTGIRIGGQGGGRSALAVADARRFRSYRKDRVLDVRQIAAALRRLRTMRRVGRDEELDIDETVDATARSCGDLEVIMRPPRRNDLRVILMMDVGGSMDPHARLMERLFSAAHQGGAFRELRSFYFHNCVYGRVYRDAQFTEPVSTAELLRTMDDRWRLILVGDAYMHPGELELSSGDWWQASRGPAGITWLARLAKNFPRAAWLNPEPKKIWRAPTIQAIGSIFPMFPLTLEGLEELVAHMRRPPDPRRLSHAHAVERGEA